MDCKVKGNDREDTFSEEKKELIELIAKYAIEVGARNALMDCVRNIIWRGWVI